MYKLIPILLLATVTPFCAWGQHSGGTLTGTLASQGLAGAKLERRYGNHLLVPVSINNRRGALMIDTGSPNTLIDRNSVNTFGLTVEKTDSSVGGLFGRAWERYGTSKVKSIAMGNCMVTNVPVAIVDLSGMNPERNAAATGSHISDAKAMAHLNGVLGAREMVKFAMIIDCTRQMLYINPNGASSAVSQSLASFLAGRGFTRVPMRLNSNAHFDVEGALNGHATFSRGYRLDNDPDRQTSRGEIRNRRDRACGLRRRRRRQPGRRSESRRCKGTGDWKFQTGKCRSGRGAHIRRYSTFEIGVGIQCRRPGPGLFVDHLR
jgi:predicted aspartyl protease